MASKLANLLSFLNNKYVLIKSHKRFFRPLVLVASIFILWGCISVVKSTSLTISSMTSTTATKVTTTIPSQVQYSSVIVDLGGGFTAENICINKTIFGRTGTGACVLSNIFRVPGTEQLLQTEETGIYSGNVSDPTLPDDYNEVPVVLSNDDGFNTTDSDAPCANGCSPIVSITAAQHAAFQNCGTSGATLAARIADCASLNGTTATWNGTDSGISGEASWSLVTRNGANKEVWQDQRTRLLWSSSLGTGDWCTASGNVENSGGVNCTAITQSYCTEILTPGVVGEDWVVDTAGSYTYDPAKGGLGKYTTPGVRWRVPTLNDYEQANIDGLRFVMPDMGALNAGGKEWTSTVVSNNRTLAWLFYSDTGQISPSALDRITDLNTIRCVGR